GVQSVMLPRFSMRSSPSRGARTMSRATLGCFLFALASFCLIGQPSIRAGDVARPAPAITEAAITAPDGWEAVSARDEIRPEFSFDPAGGSDGKGSFIIRTDEREGLAGHWTKSFPVKGGQCYRFRALRKVENAPSPRRDVLARILWQDEQKRQVL